MKDMAWFVWFALYLGILTLVEIGEDYRAERCVTHGSGHWVREPGCKSDWCDRSQGLK